MAVLHRIWSLCETGLALYFTMDAGPNVKLLFLAQDTPTVQQQFPGVEIMAPFAGK